VNCGATVGFEVASYVGLSNNPLSDDVDTFTSEIEVRETLPILNSGLNAEAESPGDKSINENAVVNVGKQCR